MSPRSGRPSILPQVTFPNNLTAVNPTLSAIRAVKQSYTPGVMIISLPFNSSLSFAVVFISPPTSFFELISFSAPPLQTRSGLQPMNLDKGVDRPFLESRAHDPKTAETFLKRRY